MEFKIEATEFTIPMGVLLGVGIPLGIFAYACVILFAFGKMNAAWEKPPGQPGVHFQHDFTYVGRFLIAMFWPLLPKILLATWIWSCCYSWGRGEVKE